MVLDYPIALYPGSPRGTRGRRAGYIRAQPCRLRLGRVRDPGLCHRGAYRRP